MKDPNFLEIIFALFIAFSSILFLYVIQKGIEKLACWEEKKEKEIKEKIAKIEIKKNIHKAINLKNYLISLATLATIGILIIAIKLL